MPDDLQASTSVNIFSCKLITFFSKNHGFISTIKDAVGWGDTQYCPNHYMPLLPSILFLLFQAKELLLKVLR